MNRNIKVGLFVAGGLGLAVAAFFLLGGASTAQAATVPLSGTAGAPAGSGQGGGASSAVGAGGTIKPPSTAVTDRAASAGSALIASVASAGAKVKSGASKLLPKSVPS